MNSWKNEDFRRIILAQARTNKMLSAQEYPNKIILNTYWHKILSEIHAKGKKEKIEFSRNIKTDMAAEKLLISKTIYTGSKNKVESLLVLEGTALKKEKKIGSIHNHPSNSPFSFYDLVDLLFIPRSLIKIIITKNKLIMLAIRTKTTPRVEENREIFIKQMKENYKASLNLNLFEKDLTAKILFCQKFDIVFYLGKICWFNKKIVLKKKKVVKKNNQ